MRDHAMKVFLLLLFSAAGLLPAPGQETPFWEPVVRQNADRFPLFSPEYDADGKALIRFLDPTQNFFVDDGRRYFGFRFRAPETPGGDFAWMFLLRNASGPESTGPMNWYIVRRNGEMEGFTQFFRKNVAAYPELKKKFPNTSTVTLQYLPRSSFVPGEEYVMWFSLLEGDNTPQFAVAFSFADSAREEPTDRLPFGQARGTARQEKKGPELTSYEGDPW